MSWLNDNVLVCNRNWQAIQVCSVARAFAHVFSGKAEAVYGDFETFDWGLWCLKSEELGIDGAETVSTPQVTVRVPWVIKLVRFDRLPVKEVKFTRHNIFERDKFTCQFCGRRFPQRELNIDHVIPREQGGTTTWENTVCSCVPCNTLKANRTPAQAGMRLLRVPKRPSWRPFVGVNIEDIERPEWKKHLDVAHWEPVVTTSDAH